MAEYRRYEDCKKDAQEKASVTGRDQGVEYNKLFGYWRFFSLPNPENRVGHELRCEVITCMLKGRGQERGKKTEKEVS